MPLTRIPYGRLDGRYVNVVGDIMTGLLTLSGAPTVDLHAATKKYADDGLALKLDLAGGDMSGQLDIIDASGAQLRLEHTEDTKFADFQVDTNHDLLIKPSSTGQIILQPTTDSTDFFQVLDADGGTPILNVDAVNERVGIGTASPSEDLEVVGSILVTGGDVHIGTPPTGFEDYGFTVNDADGGIILKRTGSSEPMVQLMNDTGQCGMIRGLNGAGGGLRFLRAWPYEVMRLTNTALVGIGTTGPDRRLDILDATYPQIRLTHTDGSVYTDFQAESDGDLSIEPTGDNVNLIDKNLLLGTTTGTQVGTSSSQKLSFWGATPIIQQAHIIDADGQLADITTKFNTLLSQLEAIGILATA